MEIVDSELTSAISEGHLGGPSALKLRSAAIIGPFPRVPLLVFILTVREPNCDAVFGGSWNISDPPPPG